MIIANKSSKDSELVRDLSPHPYEFFNVLKNSFLGLKVLPNQKHIQ
jgi:hypothetical protein